MPPQRGHAAGSESLVTVGVIRRAHGVRGEASVEPLTDDPARLAELSRVVLVSPDRSRLVASRIVSARVHRERVLVLLEAISSPEEVADYRNWSIEIDEADARRPGEDEYFIHDLVGLDLTAPDGRTVGKVTAFVEGAGQALLSIQRADGGSFDVPFTRAICIEIDLVRGTIIADLPAGLETLNDRRSAEDE